MEKREWLVQIRENANLSQKEVADSAKIHTGSYANIENGKRIPSVKTAKKIAEVLGFDWKNFFI